MPYFGPLFCHKPLPMRKRLLLYGLYIIFVARPTQANAQAINTQDSLALVDLYNSTNGPGWINHTNWLTAAPVRDWFGVAVTGSRVTSLQLINNRLSGPMPASLGSLIQLNYLNLHANRLTGTIPASLGSLVNLYLIDLSINQLGGAVPFSLTNLPSNTFLYLDHNNFNFDGLEGIVQNFPVKFLSIICVPENDIPIHKTGNVYAVSAGGTLSKNTYKWYRDAVLVATKTGDSTFTSSVPGNYDVEVSNAIVTNNPIYHGPSFELTLYGISRVDLQDSLALVELYNNTGGVNWINNHNWLTAQPLNTWYGVTVRFGRVSLLELPDNNLNGVLPASVDHLTEITTLDLKSNQLQGPIPPLTDMVNLSRLNLSRNQLNGDLPVSLGAMQRISTLDLGFNQLTGTIPAILGNIDHTNRIDLSNNNLTGSIPVELGRLKRLNALILNNNQISGQISDSLINIPSLRQLYLQNNQLSGHIPDSIVNLTDLGGLNLSHNNFTGKIPDSIGRLTVLSELSLDNNQLSGPVPVSLNNIRFRHDIHLQENKFTFDGMETLPTAVSRIYAPQASIPLHRTGNLLTVSAGGTLTNNIYNLYKNGVLQTTQAADSSFAVTNPGAYYITVTNTVATDLTLHSDTLTVDGLRLTDTSAATTQTISGIAPINIVDTPYQSLLLSITPAAGANTLGGEVNFKVTIDPVVSSFNNQPYVQRHYDITPTVNAANAQAIVTLYFTQQEFDNFNATPAHGLDLPTGPADAAGIANLRVYQYHGFSASSAPGTYAGNAVEIDPLDAGIVWDAAAAYWQVSFAVNGFSGFFVSSLNASLLPVKLAAFTGKWQDGMTILRWTTATEINTRYFELQRSSDGNAFTGIATIPAAGNSNIGVNYSYNDNAGNTAAYYYYRLKTVDADGQFSHSKVIKITRSLPAPEISVWPNPAREKLLLRLPPALGAYTVVISNMGGQTVKTMLIPAGTTQLAVNLQDLAKGVYSVVCRQGTAMLQCSLVIE
jgi:Leucine-rich repeat (LRR) protein